MKPKPPYVVIDPHTRLVYPVQRGKGAPKPKTIIGCRELGWWTEGHVIFWCDDLGLLTPGLPTFRMMRGNEESQPLAGIMVAEGGGITVEKIAARVRWSPLKSSDFSLETVVAKNFISTRAVIKPKE